MTQQPRVLSSRISTRLYRAPEVILMEKHYHTPLDIWAAGVILAELFQKIENQFNPLPGQDYHVFKGKHCFPLSPGDRIQFEEDALPDTKNDVLRSICELIGPPHSSDLEFITDPTALKYLAKFQDLHFVAL